MPGAIIAIDQDQGSPSYGTPGVARNDLWQSRLVTARSTASGNTSYLWSFLDIPPGSAATLATPTAQNATWTPDLPGSYRLQLTTNGGGPGNVQVLVAAVTKDTAGTLINRGWRVPALGETALENNFSGQTRSWDEALRFIFNDIAANVMPKAALPLPALNVDWSAADVFTKTLAAGANAITFSNTTDGKTIIVVLTGAGSTVTWPATVKWASGSAPTQTSAGTDVYTFVRAGAAIYGAVTQAMA